MIHLRRVAAGIIIVLLVALPATAGVEFAESSQEAFGFTSQGVSVEGAEGMGEFSEAWELFVGTVEGARILGKLDSNRDFEIMIEVLPEDEFDKGDEVWGRSVLFKYPNDAGQKRVTITIRKDDTGGVKNLADTIYHEFRHVEHWVDEDFDEGHDELHAGTDPGIVRYLGQLEETMTGTTSTTRIEIPPTRTPISDALMAEASNRDNFLFDAPTLHRIFDEIGEALDSIRARQEEAVYFEVTDIDAYMLNKGQFSGLGVQLDFNESIFECGQSTETRRVVCTDGVVEMPVGEVLMASMTLVSDIPLADPENSYIYSLVADSDNDGANNWVFNAPFDWDLFQGTDRWYQLSWDHRTMTWSLSLTQLTDSGGFPSGSISSTMRAVIEGNTIMFFVSMDEFEVDQPGTRFTAFHHDGQFSEATRGADVSGIDPTAPLEPVPADLVDMGW